MHPLKLILIAAAVAGLVMQVPTLIAAGGLTPAVICLAAAFYLGYTMGEMMEFCIDRYRVAKRL